jgi:outer membrane protein assembly factor BamA
VRLITGLRILGACATVAFVANAAFAAKFTDRQRTRIEEPRPAGVPSDAQLVASGAVIGKVDIVTHNIFDVSDPRDDVALFRLANRLHIRTRRSTIRAQLLFSAGQKYRPRLLAETERNLRKLPFIYDAHVVPVRYAHGKVEVAVITRDVWTLSPGVNFSRTGGTNNSSFELSDSNFLGHGKTLDFQHGRDVDRSSNTLEWSDPNVFGSHWIDALAYADSSDGRRRAVDFAHPFYALETRWSAAASAQKYQRAVSRYAYGNIGDQFEDSEVSYALSGGVSAGLVRGWTRRWLAGVHYDRNDFLVDPTTSLPARVLPASQTLAYPFLGFELIQDDYRKTGDLNQIGRTEDLYFGLQADLTVGYSAPTFGASQRAFVVTGKARKGFQIGSHQQLFASVDFQTRIEQGRARNLIADTAARYYWRWLPEWVLYVGASGTATDALDPQSQLTIGGDSGLRGYPLRYEAGSSKALVTIEQRFYTDWYPFRLVRVGGAIFADAGRAWGPAIIGGNRPGMLEDLGFGLRLGNTRTGLGNVLHIDFAFPLNAPPGVSQFQVLVQTFQSF